MSDERQATSKKSKASSVRLMAPFAMHCLSCKQFIYKGTKFNARKHSTGKTYMGIALIGFSIRCPVCSNEIVFRTDPKTHDYVLELGAERNLEPWRQKDAEEESEEARLVRLEEEEKASARKQTTLQGLEKATEVNLKEAQDERELVRLKHEADQLQSASLASARSKSVQTTRKPISANPLAKKKRKTLGLVKRTN